MPAAGGPDLRFTAPAPTAGALVAGDLRLDLTLDGDLQAIRFGSLLVSQYLPGPHDASTGGLWLRRHRDGRVESVRLVGARSTARFELGARAARWTGEGLGAQWVVTLAPGPEGDLWVWRVDLRPAGALPTDRWDLVAAQDLALAPDGAALSSEPYVSQYLAHRAVDLPGLGRVLATRQTMACAPALPLLVMAIAEGAVAHLTDAIDLYGTSARLDGRAGALARADWTGRTTQDELAMPTLLTARRPLTTPISWHVVAVVRRDRSGELAEAAEVVLDRVATARATAEGAVRCTADAPAREAGPGSAGEAGPGSAGEVRAAGPGPAGRPASIDTSTPARTASLLLRAPLLIGDPLTDEALAGLGGGEVLHPERGADGSLLSYFTAQATHVVARAKEAAAARSHGQVLKAGDAVTPGDGVLSATVYAAGVFASHVVVGNTTANRFLSVHRHQLNLLRSAGVRVLLRRDGRWQQLGVPSALVMDLGGVRWVYRTADLAVDVTTTARAHDGALEVRVRVDRQVDLLVSADVELAGAWTAAPALDGRALVVTPTAGTAAATHCPGLAYVLASPDGALGDDGPLFTDGAPARPAVGPTSYGSGVLTVAASDAREVRVVLTGSLDGAGAALRAAVPVLAAPLDLPVELAGHRETVAALTRHLHVVGDGRLAELNVLVPWFAQNALIHFLVPHGLEQYSGAAWGTRDVCQGPFELALAFDHPGTARQILLRVLAHQNPDGTLPQWFMFDAYQELYQDEAHGDVVVWPLMALAEYLASTGDLAVLDEQVPFWDGRYRRPGTEPVSVAEHLRATMRYVRAHRAPGTGLLSYGEGDWDDTLQPAQASMREEMASSWTVALLYQATSEGARLLAGTAHADLGAELAAEAALVAGEFNDRLVIDGVLSGYVVFAPEGPWPVIHPQDRRTGLHYRLIPMTRSIIAGLFSPGQAAEHEALVEQHLHYPDGVRLMDRPAPYADGVTRFFRRGEQAANIGREIGLMYTHAHIRYVEALAALGRDRLVTELLRISPVGQHERLATSLPRQRNCYFSSSDADFPDRYTAAAQWDRLRADAADPVGVRGGWRVYSSGPGIYLRQVVQGALGLVVSASGLLVDPVLATEDDGIAVQVELLGERRTVRYHVTAGTAPVQVLGDGRPLPGTSLTRPYRLGGLLLAAADLAGVAVLDVHVGADRSTLAR
jgi:cellobiose phosphorylase